MNDRADTVHAATRRIVGRVALRRCSEMVREWQHDEREKAALARTLLIAVALTGVLASLVFLLR